EKAGASVLASRPGLCSKSRPCSEASRTPSQEAFTAEPEVTKALVQQRAEQGRWRQCGAPLISHLYAAEKSAGVSWRLALLPPACTKGRLGPPGGSAGDALESGNPGSWRLALWGLIGLWHHVLHCLYPALVPQQTSPFNYQQHVTPRAALVVVAVTEGDTSVFLSFIPGKWSSWHRAEPSLTVQSSLSGFKDAPPASAAPVQ
ncbi:hypothetical protein E2I00_000771, partial [Balaenoptera physalus]